MRAAIEQPLALADAVGSPTTWVLSNHDVIRHASRYGFDPDHRFGEGLARDEVPDARLGLRRAPRDRKSTRLNSSHVAISYAVFCLKKKKAQSTRYNSNKHM